jgi:alkylation response protein AidB-like acyl-CoA dehydrogenase
MSSPSLPEKAGAGTTAARRPIPPFTAPRDGCLCADPRGAGYMAEYEIERAARDARLGPIGGGTDEIMKEILGRSLGL